MNYNEELEENLTKEEILQMVDDDIRENELREARKAEFEKKWKKEEKRRRAKIHNIKVMVVTSALASALAVSACGCIKNIHQQQKGESYLANKYYDKLGEYSISIRDDSQVGYVFTINGKGVSYEDGVKMLSEVGEQCGLSDTETYIAIKEIYTDIMAKDAVGEENVPTIEEQAEAKKTVYHEQCAKEYRGNAK